MNSYNSIPKTYSSIKNWVKDLNNISPKKIYKCPMSTWKDVQHHSSLVIRKMQIQTIMRYHFTDMWYLPDLWGGKGRKDTEFNQWSMANQMANNSNNCADMMKPQYKLWPPQLGKASWLTNTLMCEESGVPWLHREKAWELCIWDPTGPCFLRLFISLNPDLYSSY